MMMRSGARHHPDAAGSAARLYATIHEYLSMEDKFQPCLYLPTNPENGEVSSGARDGAAHVLRCLKVWYDLPPDVLIHAINLFDRFLTKMKVRPCHVPCITVSCMNIAIEEYAVGNQEARRVSCEDLVSVSQSACTVGDVSRMSRVLVDKLSLVPGATAVTPLAWLRAYCDLMYTTGEEFALPRDLYWCKESELVNLLEIVSCDAACANARTCEMALVLLYYKLESQMSAWSGTIPEEAYRLFDLGYHLQRICNMSDESLVSTRELARAVIARYENRGGATHRQRLVWRLSERTLKVLRPTDRLTSLLPTIQEQHLNDAGATRQRADSDSSENEETCDWPRSPLLPVYCNN